MSQIERFMGYKEGESHDHISALVEELFSECSSLCDIRAEYRIFDSISFMQTGRSLAIGKQVFSIDKIVYGQLKLSDSIAVFAVTAGPGPGEKTRSLMMEGDPLKGYICDVIGSEIVEAAADLMQEDLKVSMMKDGRKITNRFSPGYCGWDVSEQHKLFSLMPYNYCGIQLTPSALMEPVKSVSGFIGIGEKVRFLPYTCSLCDMKDCIYRRTVKNAAGKKSYF